MNGNTGRDTTLLLVSILTILSILLVVFNYFKEIHSRIYVKSKLNDKYYLVKNTKNSQEVADTLALLCIRSKKLIKFVENDKKFSKNVSNLAKRYTTLSENIDLMATSYTINKGEEVAMCITARDSKEKIYDENTLMFVCIHELAHIGCDTVGHNEEFQEFFKFLLKQAVICGVYTYKNYSTSPQEYCGMRITNNPLNS
jgi:hypothetical protein